MAVSDYAPGRLRYGTASAMAITFKQQDTGADGSPGGIRYLNHETLGWENEFDPAAHVRRMDTAADDPEDQSAPIPIKVTDDYSAYAVTYTVDPANNQILSKVETIGASQLYAYTRSPIA